MSTNLSSQNYESVKSIVTYFPEENINGLGLDNPEGRGVFIPPSFVPGRSDITGYFLSSLNSEGKLQWVDNPVSELKLGDLSDVDTTNVTDGQVIVYDSLNQIWIPGSTTTIVAGEALLFSGPILNVLYDNINIGLNGLNELEIIDGSISNSKLTNSSISLTNSSGLIITGSPVFLGNNVNIDVDSTVIRTTGGQTITGTLDVTGILTAGTFSDGILSISNGNLSGATNINSSNVFVGNSLEILDADQSDAVRFTVPTVITDYTLVMPDSQGANGTVLQNDGTGILSSEPTGGNPGGPNESIQFNNGGSFGGSANLTWDGNDIILSGGGSFVNSSDIRLKTNITPLKNPLKTIESINGYKYRWKKTNSIHYGVIAQELEKTVMKYIIKEQETTGYKGVDYNQIIPFLIESVKVLSKRLEILESKDL